MIEIREVTTKKELKMYAEYPIKLYKDNKYYVPSMRSDEINTFNPEKNFSLKHCDAKGFLCFKDGELVGRIAGIINNEDNRLTGKKCIRFSRLECIDDLDVFKALLGAVEAFGKERGMDTIHGPWGFNDTDREGMLTYGFDERSTYATNYYYPYFSANMEKLGFEDESKWVEYRFNIPEKVPERITQLAEKLTEKYQLVDVARTMTVKQILKKYGDGMFETLTEGYRHLDGYVPIEGEERKNMLDQFATIVNRKFISFLVDKEGKVAAFGICLPSIADALVKNKGKLFPLGFISVLKSIKNTKDLEMALIAVKDEYKNSGINAIIINNVLENIIKYGVTNLESNPMLEHNYAIRQTWKFVDTDIVKKRQTYKKAIEA